jgi:hypothetical protein
MIDLIVKAEVLHVGSTNVAISDDRTWTNERSSLDRQLVCAPHAATSKLFCGLIRLDPWWLNVRLEQ